jgi:hypothetical protein
LFAKPAAIVRHLVQIEVVMEYLVMDTHQRLLGTLRRGDPLRVGDTFSSSNLTYAVIGIEWLTDRPNMKRLTVIPINKPSIPSTPVPL